MALKIYNSLRQKLEEFVPREPGRVGMYTCGPTVYHFVHIGNFRTFAFQDLLRRYLRYCGYQLTHVMNITDVEDKIIANAREAGVSIDEYTERFTRAFLEDMQTLRIEQPEIMPRATRHIDSMIELILKLKEQGHTYQSEGSTYFRISSFPGYGKLSHTDLTSVQSAGRIDSDEYSKESARDFVLWKAHKPGEPYWDSPMGKGRPGWHVECSAMSMAYLGDSFDIHCGGVDLIFPHHENEIAQSEGATGHPFVQYWLHSEHLIVEGEKMSKSKGNFYTLRDLLDKDCDPVALRYLLQSVHYRKKLNFSLEGVEQAKRELERANNFLIRVREVPAGRSGDPQVSEQVAEARKGFEAGLDDDLNVSAATGALFELVKEVNPLLDRGEVGTSSRDEILDLFAAADRVFDVFKLEADQIEDEEILRLIDERSQARQRREYSRADEIREILAQSGVLLEDTKEGTRWKRVN